MKLNLKQKVVNSSHQEKPFAQVEGELTEAQLEAIAGGGPETSPNK